MKEYPTEDDLKRIEEWDAIKDAQGLIDFISELWSYPDYFKRECEVLELHTGGWSGNESVIEALEKNLMFYALFWQKSERGGHYYFTVRKFSDAK